MSIACARRACGWFIVVNNNANSQSQFAVKMRSFPFATSVSSVLLMTVELLNSDVDVLTGLAHTTHTHKPPAHKSLLRPQN